MLLNLTVRPVPTPEVTKQFTLNWLVSYVGIPEASFLRHEDAKRYIKLMCVAYTHKPESFTIEEVL